MVAAMLPDSRRRQRSYNRTQGDGGVAELKATAVLQGVSS
jgi:hypothetical protein